MAKALVASLAALLVLSGCGSVKTQGSSTPLPRPSPPAAALEMWKDFPANSNPRPLIVFERSIERIGQEGFSSEPNRKVAWGCNKFTFAPGVQTSTLVPGAVIAGGVSFPGISSAHAYSELIAARKPVEALPPDCSTYGPFVIKSIRLGTADFFTDRGSVSLPAWLFDVTEIRAYLAYVAIDPVAFWAGGHVEEGMGAGVSADGWTLKIGVSNAQAGPCGADYTATAAESSTAVAVAVMRIPHALPNEEVACDLMLRVSFIEVKLKAPLGDRVLLDEQGRVGAACLGKDSCEDSYVS